MQSRPGIDNTLENATDRVRDAANDGVARGNQWLQPFLDFELFAVSGITCVRPKAPTGLRAPIENPDSCFTRLWNQMRNSTGFKPARARPG